LTHSAAQEDAAETIPFGPIAGIDITAPDLFHLAPVTTLKFRSLPRSRHNLKRATDAALASYVATISDSPHLKQYPTVCFAFAYLASHYGLDLVSEARVNQVMAYIAAKPSRLLGRTGELDPPVKQRRSTRFRTSIRPNHSGSQRLRTSKKRSAT